MSDTEKFLGFRGLLGRAEQYLEFAFNLERQGACNLAEKSLERERVNKGTERMNSLPLSPVVLSSTLQAWKAKWCKIQETKLASSSTNMLSKSWEISIKLTKINSNSTRFSLEAKTFRIKLKKITSSLSRNYLLRARDVWIELKRSLKLLSTKNLSNFNPKGTKL